MRSRVVHVSSDATPLHHAAVDWKYKVAARSEVHPYLEALKRVLATSGDCEEETGIAVAELLSIVTFAAQRGPHWRQQVVLYAGDNENCVTWLRRRRPRPAAARTVLRVLAWLEAHFEFEVAPVYVRTYHNRTPDYFTRCSEEEYHTRCRELNLTDMSLAVPWEEAITAEQRSRPFLLLGLTSDQQAAMLVREDLRQPVRPSPSRIGPHIQYLSHSRQFPALRMQGAAEKGLKVLAVAAGADPTGRELERLCWEAKRRHADLLCFECHR
eukprot:314918-Amphidinium_carterae.1